MLVAFLTDVHGNLPALAAVLADACAQGVAAVWDGGDTVGYHPWPSECVMRLAEADAVSVMGNYDRKVLKAPRRRQRWLRTKSPLKADALIWAWEHLTTDARELLSARRGKYRPTTGRLRVLVCHGSPLSRKEPLGSATTAVRWRELAVAADADLVLHGHTHLAYTRREGGTLFVNPGAVGRSEDGDPRAAYALVDLAGKRPAVALRRVAYDTDAVIAAVAEQGLPEVFGVMARRGLSLPRAQRRLARGRN